MWVEMKFISDVTFPSWLKSKYLFDVSFMSRSGKSVDLNFFEHQSDISNGKFAFYLENQSKIVPIISIYTLRFFIGPQNQIHI